MNRVLYLMAASLALAAGPRLVMFAEPIRDAAGPVEILVDGAPQPRLAHDGRWYVEALKGKEYAIRLRNPYPVRVAVALSVDGLNTIDARETKAAGARKWVLNPYETVTISGWQTSRTEARRFEFTTEASSYAQALGKTANLGVISAVFFSERTPVTVARQPPVTVAGQTPSAAAAGPVAPPTGTVAENAAGAASGGGGAGATSARRADEYAATGMGRQTDHPVEQVWLDLEDAPAQSVNIRYEFRPQLVKLGILPATPAADPLDRREHAHGFEPGYSPVPPGLR